MEAGITAMGLDSFFEKTFGGHVDLAKIPEAERQAYLEEWGQEGALTAMLNWYRASDMVVPAIGEQASTPLWTSLPFPSLKMPTLVIWGLKDKALLPIQLGLQDLIEQFSLAASPDAGHFIPWEYPEFVVEAIRDFIAETTRG